MAPIVLFVYQRPNHTQKVLEALSEDPLASKSTLYIFADGPKQVSNADEQEKIRQTRAIIQNFKGCKEVHLQLKDNNEGLAKSIVDGVSQVVKKHGKVIVLEDDILISPFFLTYMNQALSLYEKEDQVMHIGSFVPQRKGWEKLPDTYFLRFMSCWGWATWLRAWEKLELNSQVLWEEIAARKDKQLFDLENSIGVLKQLKDNCQGKMSTWAIKWYSSIFLANGLCLYPNQSLSAQIGLDGSGVHGDIDHEHSYRVELANAIQLEKIPIVQSSYAYAYLQKFYRYGNFKGWKAIKQHLRYYKQQLGY